MDIFDLGVGAVEKAHAKGKQSRAVNTYNESDDEDYEGNFDALNAGIGGVRAFRTGKKFASSNTGQKLGSAFSKFLAATWWIWVILLLFFIIFYMCYMFLFGHSYAIEYAINHMPVTYGEYAALNNLSEQGFAYITNDDGSITVRWIDDYSFSDNGYTADDIYYNENHYGEVTNIASKSDIYSCESAKKILESQQMVNGVVKTYDVYEGPFEAFIQYPQNVRKLIDAGIWDIEQGDTFLLSGEDIKSFLSSIDSLEALARQHQTVNYSQYYKTYDYIWAYDGYWEGDEPAMHQTDELMWMPGDTKYVDTGYADDEAKKWINPGDELISPDEEASGAVKFAKYTDSKVAVLSRGTIEGETETYAIKSLKSQETTNTFDISITTPKFISHWQTMFAIGEMASSQSYADEENLVKQDFNDEEGLINVNWGHTGDDSEEEFDGEHLGEYTESLDGYYLSDETINKIVDALSYKFDFYTDINEGESVRKYTVDDLTRDIKSTVELEDGKSLNPAKITESMLHYSEKLVGYVSDSLIGAPKKFRSVGGPMTWDEIENYSYKIDMENSQDVIAQTGEAGEVAFIEKIPERAPNQIYNLYETYKYEYEEVSSDDFEDGNTYGKYICKSRKRIVNAIAFYDFMNELCDDFDWDTFIEILEHYPCADKEVQKIRELKEIYEYQVANGLPNVVTEELNTEGSFYSYGVIIGTGNSATPTKSGVIATYPKALPYMSGEVYDYVYVIPSGNYCTKEGWVGIDTDALNKSLGTSDNLSLAQCQAICDYLQTRADAAIPFSTAAEGLYEFQQETGCSVCGLIAIWLTEQGSFQNRGNNAVWNFGNIKASAGMPARSDNSTWLDVKAYVNGDFGEAIKYSLKGFVYKNYIMNGQDTYFKMSWRVGSSFYNAQSREEAEAQTAALTHCYCPYYDDTAISYDITDEPVEGKTYRHWANNNASNRRLLESVAGI